MQEPGLEITSRKSFIFSKIRRLCWLVLGILVFILIVDLVIVGYKTIRQAVGVRDLLQAASGYSKDEIANDFVCLRQAGDINKAQDARTKLNDHYLLGVAFCMSGETSAGIEMLKSDKQSKFSQLQFAAALAGEDPQGGVKALAQLKMDDRLLTSVLENLIRQPSVDPRPAIRFMVQTAPGSPESWMMWIQGGAQLEASENWQEAVDWLNEGLLSAPPFFQSTLYLNLGYIYQWQSKPVDYQKALSYYQLALARRGWIETQDEANAHWYIGEVYLLLKNEYSPDEAISELNLALQQQPNNYWLLIEIGKTYQYDLFDLNTAESFYRQAMAVNDLYPEAYLFIGDIFRTRNDSTAAIAWYQQAIDQSPAYQPALDRIKSIQGK